MVRKRRVTSQDVANRAGVSRTTVSFVLNDVEANISPETRQRVLQAAEELGYVPNAAARALAGRRTHTLALVLIRETAHLISDAFLPSVMQGLISVVRPAGFRVLLEPVANADEPDLYLNLVRAQHIDGIVLSGPRSDDAQLTELIASGFPVVLLGQLPGTQASFVDVDNRQAAQLAVEHLIEQGHQRIGYISNGPLAYTGAADRLAGYQAALETHGLPLNESLMSAGDFGPESGREAAQTLLDQSSEPPSAIFVASDVVAVGVMNMLHELGFSIPGDIALVGYDDIPIARYLTPPLSTVRLPAFELGKKSGEVLLSKIGTNGTAPTQLLLETELIIRESSR